MGAVLPQPDSLTAILCLYNKHGVFKRVDCYVFICLGLQYTMLFTKLYSRLYKNFPSFCLCLPCWFCLHKVALIPLGYSQQLCFGLAIIRFPQSCLAQSSPTQFHRRYVHKGSFFPTAVGIHVVLHSYTALHACTQPNTFSGHVIML